METIEQEQRELREHVSSLKVGMDKGTALLESFVAIQNHSPPLARPK